MTGSEIPVNTVKRLIWGSGKGVRVSHEAAELLARELEKVTHDVSEVAIMLAAHDNRKTVKPRDMRQAIELCMEGR